MAVRRLYHEQPASFAFTEENLAWARREIGKYPDGRQASAVIPLLWRAQEQHEGWLPEPALRYIADMLDMPYIRVYEVATFYTMFQLQPVGRKAHVQVCGTTPCMLRGSGELIAVCKERIAPQAHEVSADGDFSWEEVECIGACVNAPLVQIFKDTYEDLTRDSFIAVLDGFARGEHPQPGPQLDRLSSAPIGGMTTLLNEEAIGAARPVRTHPPEREEGQAALAEKTSASPRAEAARSEQAGRPRLAETPSEAEAARTPAQADPKREPDAKAAEHAAQDPAKTEPDPDGADPRQEDK